MAPPPAKTPVVLPLDHVAGSDGPRIAAPPSRAPPALTSPRIAWRSSLPPPAATGRTTDMAKACHRPLPGRVRRAPGRRRPGGRRPRGRRRRPGGREPVRGYRHRRLRARRRLASASLRTSCAGTGGAPPNRAITRRSAWSYGPSRIGPHRPSQRRAPGRSRRRGRGSTGRRWGRCKRCKGSGERIRWGYRLLRHIKRG